MSGIVLLSCRSCCGGVEKVPFCDRHGAYEAELALSMHFDVEFEHSTCLYRLFADLEGRSFWEWLDLPEQ
jgi:hypothetical protein